MNPIIDRLNEKMHGIQFACDSLIKREKKYKTFIHSLHVKFTNMSHKTNKCNNNPWYIDKHHQLL